MRTRRQRSLFVFCFFGLAILTRAISATQMRDEKLQDCAAELGGPQAIQALRILKEISRPLMGHGRLQIALRDVSEILVKHFELRGVRIWLHDAGGSRLHFAGASNSFTQPEPADLPMDDKLFALGRVLQTRESYRSQSPQADPLVPQMPWLSEHNIQGYLSIPLLASDQVVGVIELFSQSALNDDVVNVINCISDELALGIEKKRMEWYLLHSKMMDAMNSLSAGLAHKLNNLFTVIVGYMELAQTSLEPEHQSHHYLTPAYSALNDALALIKTLTKFTQQITSKESETLSLGTLIAQTLATLRPRLPGNVRVSENLGTHVYYVQGERAKLEEVLVHLIQNSVDAVKRKPSGSIGIQVEETVPPNHLSLPPGRYVRIQITDNGEGIAPDNFSRIFEPFFTTRRAERNGLGLFSVHHIVREHNGIVTLTNSAVNIGSTFSIFLPLAEPLAHEVPPGKKIALISCDDPGLVTLFRVVMESAEFEVQVESDIKTAVDRARYVSAVLTTSQDLVVALAEKLPQRPVIYAGFVPFTSRLSRPERFYQHVSNKGVADLMEWLREQLAR